MEWRSAPVDLPALAIVREGQPADLAGAVDTVQPWASVTKLVTALAVHCGHRDEWLDLDEPWGPPGATVRHLLAHASGLPFEGAAPVSAPEHRRVYSNSGMDLLGDLLAGRMQVSLPQALRTLVLGPLGMASSELVGRASAGMQGPVRDLARLAAELRRPTLLEPEAHAEMVTVAYPGLDGVLPGFGSQHPNDWALGPEVRGHKSPHWTAATASPRTYGHFGQSGSFLWVDPDADVACAFLCGQPFGEWATAWWPQLSAAVLAGTSAGDLAGSGV